MAGEERILAAVAARPDACSPVHWGKRLSAVRIALPVADQDLVAELLHAAWALKSGSRRG